MGWFRDWPPGQGVPAACVGQATIMPGAGATPEAVPFTTPDDPAEADPVETEPVEDEPVPPEPTFPDPPPVPPGKGTGRGTTADPKGTEARTDPPDPSSSSVPWTSVPA